MKILDYCFYRLSAFYRKMKNVDGNRAAIGVLSYCTFLSLAHISTLVNYLIYGVLTVYKYAIVGIAIASYITYFIIYRSEDKYIRLQAMYIRETRRSKRRHGIIIVAYIVVITFLLFGIGFYKTYNK